MPYRRVGWARSHDRQWQCILAMFGRSDIPPKVWFAPGYTHNLSAPMISAQRPA